MSEPQKKPRRPEKPRKPERKPSRRSQSERRDESTNRLLTAAAELIAMEGYAAASLERVGQLAGYSRGLASQKFGSKEGLIAAVAVFLAARINALVAERCREAETPAREILAYAEVVLTQFETDRLVRAYFILMTAAIASRLSVQDVFFAEHEAVKRRLSDAILRGQQAGEINPALDPDAAAISVGSTLLGIGVELLLDPDMDIDKVRMSVLDGISLALAPNANSAGSSGKLRSLSG